MARSRHPSTELPPLAGRLDPHRKPLNRQARRQLQFAGGFKQSLGLQARARETGQICRHRLQLGKPGLKPGQGFGRRENPLAATWLKHHVMI